MEWLNIHTRTLDSPEFVGAEPLDRATWLCVLRYCIGQENGGRIIGGAEWSDRQWQQIVRVTKAEIERPCALWTREGVDILVSFYPLDKQAEIQAKRAAGKVTNAKRWTKPTDSANRLANRSADTEGKGIGKELELELEREPAARGTVSITPAQIYRVYPNQMKPKAAIKAITAAMQEVAPERLLERTTAYAAAVALWPAAEMKFIPHPASWFNAGSYDEDPKKWVKKSDARPGQRDSHNADTNKF